MKTGRPSLGESPRAHEYDWIESYMGRRTPASSEAESSGSARVAGKNDLLRTILFALLFGGLATLLVRFSIGVAAGRGRSIFQFTATLAAFLACGAVASRRRKLLRFVLALGSLCVSALLVDQYVYSRWHERVESVVTNLQQRIEPGSPGIPHAMTVRPTSFWIDPDQDVLLIFEPPLLAWTYQLDSASPLGHALIATWHRILARVARGLDLDRVARTLVRPHQVYTVGVKPAERTLACRQDTGGYWTLSIDRRPGDRPR